MSNQHERINATLRARGITARELSGDRWRELAAQVVAVEWRQSWRHPFKTRRNLEALARLFAIEPTWWEGNARLRGRVNAKIDARMAFVNEIFDEVLAIPIVKPRRISVCGRCFEAEHVGRPCFVYGVKGEGS